jgi:predicted membrane protein
MVIAPLLNSKLAFSFLGVQLAFGSLIPILLLGIIVLMRPYLTNPLRNTIALIASLILLVQVFAMRWNVVIGGQLFSKSLRGFRENYFPEFFDKEGIVPAVIILIAPFVVLAGFNRFLPLYHKPPESGTGEEGGS